MINEYYAVVLPIVFIAFMVITIVFGGEAE